MIDSALTDRTHMAVVIVARRRGGEDNSQNTQYRVIGPAVHTCVEVVSASLDEVGSFLLCGLSDWAGGGRGGHHALHLQNSG